MSLRAKLIAAANAAAVEATTNERARALWCIDQVMIELRKKLDGKLLSTVQLEAAKMKSRIADAVCMELRRAIVSGVRPPASRGGVTGQANVADTSPLEGKCRICSRQWDDPRGCDKELVHPDRLV